MTTESGRVMRKIARYLRRIGALSHARAQLIYHRDGLNRARDHKTIWHCVDIDSLNDIAQARRRGSLGVARRMMGYYRNARGKRWL